MIKHRTFSARAENTQTGRHLAALAVAASLSLVPVAGYGAESPGSGAKPADTFERLTLPPIPYLNTMPWSEWERTNATIKVDTLLSPVLGPSGIRLDATPHDQGRSQPAMS
ncbi:hypothetical protein [Bradyrhizobium centrosematis]|jgi:hypothetical protein|uniref:hypothetical protein n=1 Tax=Bradyrhizobium centrosematis TaxID=1300039 RepID=UPI0021687617|nr:hypothetical protein [Bradyrhizobium centrosematis]MCS3761267.1 hypothetical protein [Bradyrhizobium centrosematis]MCS3770845.1 hypothetical protein [Bradyrhizobium centrosematis]